LNVTKCLAINTAYLKIHEFRVENVPFASYNVHSDRRGGALENSKFRGDVLVDVGASAPIVE
jgi:hypothetical protein